MELVVTYSKGNSFRDRINLFWRKGYQCPFHLLLSLHDFGSSSNTSYRMRHFRNWIPVEKGFQRTSEGLPVLHHINRHIFCAPCPNTVESGLYLSDYSRENNDTDLYIEGDCTDVLRFAAGSSRCDDLALISVLGDIKLEELTASRVLEYSFGYEDIIAPNTTYAVMSSSPWRRYVIP
eukprot:TRINITY_DN4952_c0_g1_i2.p1 TRINITY_DN4952_c0_g1~~TRINITY_DN4952_c0_g1_i2.p1  ORF type:complete len:178 (-),score=12.22 TRINITY_DN4952_c0_g1_i2:44-577(-)